MLAVHLVTVLLLAAAWTAPEVSEDEGSYASRFYRWFSESSKSCLLFLVAPPGLIDTLAQLLAWRSLLWLSMIWWWMYLTQSDFLSTTSLAWSLALHLLFCFSQEKPLRWKEINTHTHTRYQQLTRSTQWILFQEVHLLSNFIMLHNRVVITHLHLCFGPMESSPKAMIISGPRHISRFKIEIQCPLAKNINVNTEKPKYKRIYQRTTAFQQRKQKIIFLALRKEKRYQHVKYLSS